MAIETSDVGKMVKILETATFLIIILGPNYSKRCLSIGKY